MAGGFEDQPATKRDLAETAEELTKEIQRVEGALGAEIQRVESTLGERMDRVEGALGAEIQRVESTLGERMDKGFRNLEEILKGPEGLLERLERVEERVGL